MSDDDRRGPALGVYGDWVLLDGEARWREYSDAATYILRLQAESATKSDRIQELEDRISDRDVEIERLRSLVSAQDELLVSYRLGRAASDQLLDRITRLKDDPTWSGEE